MSTFISVEAMLLQVHQSLRCEPYQTKKKHNFATGQGRLEGHIAMGKEILDAIFDALEIDLRARIDVLGNFKNLGDAHKAIELNTWTFGADRRQILWMLLGYFYVPGLARFSAFWSLEETLDQGMPGGRFWYLPEISEKDGKPSLNLPVAQVVDWLLDLLGMPLEEFADSRSEATDEAHEGLRRTLYNWRKDTIPNPDSFQKYFSDNLEIKFKGAFNLKSSLSPAEQFNEALDFIKRKQLTADNLRQEMPMTQKGRLEAVLSGRADEEEIQFFVKHLAVRYATPSSRIVRQRFLFARFIQDGYVRLLKELFPSVDRLCADVQQNKLLQLVNIYKYIYNLTIAAEKVCDGQGEAVANTWFEGKLPSWHLYGLFISILPSQREHSNFALSEILTRHFALSKSGDALEDLFEWSEESALSIIQRNAERIKAAADEERAGADLVLRLRKASPWRTLQEEDRYWVLLNVSQHKELGKKIQQAVIQRLHEVAKAPSEILGVICLELDSYLNNDRRNRPKDTRTLVQVLIEKAESNSDYELWKMVILQYKAKHLLACNDFDGAGRLLSEALEASRECHFGPVRGEVARDCLAVAVANRKLIVSNHEKYHREMLAGNIIVMDSDMEIPRIEEIAFETSEYFWNTLYKPYPGELVQQPLAIETFKKIFIEIMHLISIGDQNGLYAWIKANDQLLKSSLPYVDGNSVLMLLIKMRFSPQSALHPALSEQWRQFLGVLAQQAPKQLNIADFKGQTPLMLLAEAGDTELVSIMLQAGADPDMQDYHGMTALNSAIKTCVEDCVDVLLDYPCRLDILTEDGQSPLHTAAWSANLYAVNRLLKMRPQLAWQRNTHNETPLERIEYLIEEPAVLQALNRELLKQGRKSVLKSELKSIVSVLEMAFRSGDYYSSTPQ